MAENPKFKIQGIALTEKQIKDFKDLSDQDFLDSLNLLLEKYTNDLFSESSNYGYSCGYDEGYEDAMKDMTSPQLNIKNDH